MRRIDFPNQDFLQAKQSIASNNCCYFAPHHVEVFTDFVMNWEIGQRLSKKMAFWAGADLVNGPMKAVWLRHNIIANTVGGAGKAYSLENVLNGYGVLLHPEGKVAWTRDFQHKVYPGVATLAIDAVRACRQNSEYSSKKVLIQPVLYRYSFTECAGQALLKEISLINTRLAFIDDSMLEKAIDKKTPESNNLEHSLSHAFELLSYNIYKRQVKAYKLDLDSSIENIGKKNFWPAQENLLNALLDLSEKDWQVTLQNKAEQKYYDRVIRLEKKMHLKARKNKDFAVDLAQHEMRVEELWYLHRFSKKYYNSEYWSQEHIAECLQRIREMYFVGGTFDAVRKMVPLPVADRMVSVRMPKAIDVAELMTDSRSVSIKNILQAYKSSIKEGLDILQKEDQQAQKNVIVNPFYLVEV